MIATPRPLPWTSRVLTWGGLGFALIFLALIAPVNHDESQYLAAAELTRSHRPFVDFLYLQTPLQPYLTAPIAALAGSYSVIALRVTTALMALATLLLVFHSQLRLGVEHRTAFAATLLLALTDSFQFGAAVVRNDMLPALLLAMGIYAALSAMGGGRRTWAWATAGLAFGAAASTKISYALPAAAVGLFLLLKLLRRRDGASLADAMACATGALVGLLGSVIPYMAAPQAFLYGVIEYGVEAPFHWYQQNGMGYRLGLEQKLIDTLNALLPGPALVALALCAWSAVRHGKHGDPHRLLNLLIVAGLIAALLPTPTWRQYLIPVLPPLFIRLGLAWQEGGLSGRWRSVAIAAFAVTALIGLIEPIRWASRLVRGKSNPMTITNEAHWIGERLRLANARGEIATLSPQVVVDSGFPLDRRFATGPFVYRSADLLPDERQRLLHVASPRTLDHFLGERPPAAIVTGYEERDKSRRIDLDGGLRRYAIGNGYRLERSPFGDAQLYIRPASSSK